MSLPVQEHVQVVRVTDLDRDLPTCIAIRERVFSDLTEKLAAKKGIPPKEMRTPTVRSAADRELYHFLAYYTESVATAASELAAGADSDPTAKSGQPGEPIPVGTLRLMVQKSPERLLEYIDKNSANIPAEELESLRRAKCDDDVDTQALYYARVSQLAVLPDHHKHGVGRRLMAAAEGFVKEEFGVRLMKLHAAEDAVHFYRKLGYKDIGKPYIEGDIVIQDVYKEM